MALERYEKLCKAWEAEAKINELSKATMESYMRTFRKYKEFMAENSYSEPTFESTAMFKLSLGDIKITSLNLYMQHLKILSSFGMDNEMLEKPFVKASQMPPKKKLNNERSKPYAHDLDEDSFDALVFATKPNYGRKPHSWAREHCECVLLCTTGLRNSELRDLRLSDLDAENGVIRVRNGKGGKFRTIPYPNVAKVAVEEYLESGLRPSWVSDDDYLFGVNNKGNYHPLGREQLSTLINHHVASIIGRNDCYTHCLRHLFASKLYTENVDLSIVQSAMGHTSPSTTLLYAKHMKNEERMKNLANLIDNTLTKKEICA